MHHVTTSKYCENDLYTSFDMQTNTSLQYSIGQTLLLPGLQDITEVISCKPGRYTVCKVVTF